MRGGGNVGSTDGWGMRGGRGGRGIFARRHEPTEHRPGVVLEEQELFPENLSVARAEPLSEIDQKLVTYNRLLINSWTTSIFNVPQKPQKEEIRQHESTYEDNNSKLEKQKNTIVSFAGPMYFPAELLQSMPPKSSSQKLTYLLLTDSAHGAKMNREKLKEMEEKEKEGTQNEEKAELLKAQQEEEALSFVQYEMEDSEEDDYRKDYGLEEDLEDLEKGDEGDIF